MSSGSKAGKTSDRHAAVGGGAPRSTREAGRRPWREGGAQSKLFDEGTTAAPEADLPVCPKLAELAARARKEDRLTNVVQFVDDELLRLAFRSLRKQAAPGVDGQRYEDYAANVDENLKDLHTRLTTGRYQAPVIRRVSHPEGKRKAPGARHHHDRRSSGAKGGGLGAVGCVRARFLGLLARFPTKAECAYGATPTAERNVAALGQVRSGS
jgi:hypothetical protein